MKWWAKVDVKWSENSPANENWNWLKEWPEVKWAWSTMGDWDMTLWVDVASPDELEKFVHEKVWSKKWVKDTKSTWSKEMWSAA